MPTYEYKCPKCESRIKVVRGINEKEEQQQCETCNSPMNKVYSIGAVTFNGSGFYSKDK